ncbi:Hypothetical_protein [Hexamita inflata]|uniref:Hypothetical_protein n=1 Tax=Hexamita inflata TaxID=28002 RepID=A0AA86TQ27_9EUKA|nr:Hypothetical protein HINF_LOCUS11730 [Hexamita inflata]
MCSVEILIYSAHIQVVIVTKESEPIDNLSRIIQFIPVFCSQFSIAKYSKKRKQHNFPKPIEVVLFKYQLYTNYGYFQSRYHIFLKYSEFIYDATDNQLFVLIRSQKSGNMLIPLLNYEFFVSFQKDYDIIYFTPISAQQ